MVKNGEKWYIIKEKKKTGGHDAREQMRDYTNRKKRV